MTVQTPASCRCGVPKVSRKGFLICPHCDQPCGRKANVCAFCRSLLKVTR